MFYSCFNFFTASHSFQEDADIAFNGAPYSHTWSYQSIGEGVYQVIYWYLSCCEV